MCSGFKVLVDCRHVQHHVLPIRPFSSHHFINVLAEKEEAWLEFHVTSPNSLLAAALGLLGLERGLEGLFWSKPDQKRQRPDQDTCSTLPSAPGSTSSLGVSVASEPPAPAQVPYQGHPVAPQGWEGFIYHWDFLLYLPFFLNSPYGHF